jgi:hypothetical protein
MVAPTKPKSKPGSSRRRDAKPAAKPRSARGGVAAAGRNVAAAGDRIVRTLLAPLNAVLLTPKQIGDVLEDAVERGRMTRRDAQETIQSLLDKGTRQTESLRSDVERLVGRSGADLGKGAGRAGGARKRGGRQKSAAEQLPIVGYDELSATRVQDKLDGLTPAELRKLRDYERRHANRKTVLDAIGRKLR